MTIPHRSVLRRLAGYARWKLRRIRGSLADAGRVRERGSYLLREIIPRPTTGRYALRGSSGSVVLRHHTDDTGVFAEIFRKQYYVLPVDVSAELRALGTTARFIDLGANVGLFAVWALTHFPRARVTAIEPDPINLKMLREVMALNGFGDRWKVIPACASNRAGTAPFDVTGTSVSRMMATTGGHAVIEVPVIDVFDHLQRADVVKMDIEGGEWDILLDSRWSQISASAVLMEYHPYLCPDADPRGLAYERLAHAGFTVTAFADNRGGHGMLRATRH